MADYEQYDHSEDDPYELPGSTCLRNLLNITDTTSLNQAEQAFSSAAIADLIRNPVTPTFNFDHLRAIHRHLFQDIYEWAGKPRETEISKSQRLFLPYRLITQHAEQVFAGLHAEHLLAGLDKVAFAARAAYYLGRINAIHPFREGNGRTQRIFIDQLAERYGFAFTWTAISGQQMAEACFESRTIDANAPRLKRLLQLNIVDLPPL